MHSGDEEKGSAQTLGYQALESTDSKIQKQFFLWKLEDVETVPERPVRLTFQKYRARHFLMSRAQLENGMKIALPSRLSLHSTSGFF